MTSEARKAAQRTASQAYRDRRKAEGNPAKGGGGPGGDSTGTQAERARRYRERKKKAAGQNPSAE